MKYGRGAHTARFSEVLGLVLRGVFTSGDKLERNTVAASGRRFPFEKKIHALLEEMQKPGS